MTHEIVNGGGAGSAAEDPNGAPREPLDLLIIGGGPSGLATAIAAARAGLNYLVIEKGVLVNSIFNFPTNMIFFTTPELLEIGGLPLTTPFPKPTRMEALGYYRRVTDTFELRVSFNEKVDKVEPGAGAFKVTSRSKDGHLRVRSSRYVVVATGYYDNPNLLGIRGEDLPHVSHYYTESHGFYRKRVVVVGGHNSAAETALDLFRCGAQVTLVHRGAKPGDAIKYWVRPDLENRLKEGSIAARFNACLREILPAFVRVESDGACEEIPADAVFLMTGYHPDFEFLREAGIAVNQETCVPLHDPETLETNVPGLFLAGAVIAGRNTNLVFIENGRFHGERVVSTIRERLVQNKSRRDRRITGSKQ